MLKDRFLEHKGYANTNNQTKATGIHFSQKGHSVSNMKITVLEKVFNSNPQFRKQRKKMYIQKFNTKYKGLNRINNTNICRKGQKIPEISAKKSTEILLSLRHDVKDFYSIVASHFINAGRAGFTHFHFLLSSLAKNVNLSSLVGLHPLQGPW